MQRQITHTIHISAKKVVPVSYTHLMKNHPLTPMWESEIAKLMDPQGKYQTLNVNTELLAKSKEEILAVVDEFGKDKEHFYIVPDYVNDENGTKIAEVFGDLTVLTGGSGILAPLAAKYQQAQTCLLYTSSDRRYNLFSEARRFHLPLRI